jgi:UDP-N-acetylmuramate--L-alanine ligase/UDP-N-acetylenolpyruvoylglucosamine reductase
MLKQATSVFFLGIKGVAMANLAVFLKKMGKSVNGTDTSEVFITDELLQKNGINYLSGFDPGTLPKSTDLIVYSAAHTGINSPLVKEAIKRKINVISQAELIGEIMKEFEVNIGVSGCHGKTTTSSFLVYALDQLKARPSFLVGVPFFTGHQGVGHQGNKYFVVEADEYGVNPPTDLTPKFHKLNPDYIVTTNIDFDHPDVYKDLDETKEAYLKYFEKALKGNIKAPFIFRSDDANLMDLAKKLPQGSYVTCGYDENADLKIINPRITEDYSYFELIEKSSGKNLGEFKISIPGKMNIGNAASVVLTLITLGFPLEEIRSAIVGFTGSERRFEKIFKNKDYYLFDDYAHHPSEIKTTIDAARERFPGRRIIVIFQPHTFSRTATLLEDFAKRLSDADLSLILPIFASAREDVSQFKITSKDIAEKGTADKIIAFTDKQKLLDQLKGLIAPDDVIFTMGAGDVYKLKDEIIKIIDQKKSPLKIEKDKDLYLYLTLKTHVKAEYFIEARTRQDLIEAKAYSIKNKIPLFILGGGSNLAILKKEIGGLVVKNNYKEFEVIEENADHAVVSVSSGYPVSLLIANTVSRGFEGFEYHQGLPGTVGGAIYMNSKWTKPPTYFGDPLVYAFLLDQNGKVKKVDRNYFQFAYDNSILQKTRETVLEVVFELKKTDPKGLKEKAAWALAYRKKTQPFGIASSGCFFRNISLKDKERLNLPTTSAGYLIDRSGLKGYEVGAFYVSPIHANFIVNRKEGRREDLIKLLETIKSKVRQNFGVELEEEVIIV